MAMDVDALVALIVERFPGVVEIRDSGDSFFVYDPEGDLPADRWLPFATIVTDDRHDPASQLDRPGVYRLNIGLPKALFRERFGEPPTRRDAVGVLEAPVDYAALDTLMPHPVYGSQYWVCVLNPEETLGEAHRLLAEAYAFAVRKHENRRARDGRGTSEAEAG